MFLTHAATAKVFIYPILCHLAVTEETVWSRNMAPAQLVTAADREPRPSVHRRLVNTCSTPGLGAARSKPTATKGFLLLCPPRGCELTFTQALSPQQRPNGRKAD